jgi:SAM-dependent methyltransferase
MTFDPNTYWEKRLTTNFSLRGVGDIRFPISYNRYLYALRRRAFRRTIRDVGLDCCFADVLDIGSGVGFYINEWVRVNARSVTGSDITEKAVARLSEIYRDCQFIRWDAGGDDLPFKKKFQVISAFDVLFHIIDDERFERAVHNISKLLEGGGYFLYSDCLMPKEKKRQEHIVFRKEETTLEIMKKHGLIPVARRRVFYMMDDPVVTEFRLPQRLFRLNLMLATRNELMGFLAGAFAYAVEILFLTLPLSATGTEIIAFQKRR